MTQPPIDRSVLVEIVGDDDALCREIYDEFINSATPYLMELEQAFSEENTDGIRALAHKLKSSSRTVGALSLGDLCETLEHTAQDGLWEPIPSLYEKVKSELQRAVNYIQHEM